MNKMLYRSIISIFVIVSFVIVLIYAAISYFSEDKDNKEFCLREYPEEMLYNCSGKVYANYHNSLVNYDRMTEAGCKPFDIESGKLYYITNCEGRYEYRLKREIFVGVEK